ncbi:MAG: DUF1203 domain-containing protein [Pseudomonadota bacterium]
MPKVIANAIPTEEAAAFRSGAPDANGQPPERAISPGSGYPCRHCLKYIPQGKPYLTLAYRPFDSLQPYAELGPIFLCADACERWDGDEMPPVLAQSPEARLLKGYSPDNRIVYGLGRIVHRDDIANEAADMLADQRVAYVHARSSENNCFTCRIDAKG